MATTIFSSFTKLSCALIFIFSCAVGFTQGEVFTAMAHVERVIVAESEIVELLTRYVETEELRLEKIRRYVAAFAQQYQRANSTSETIVGNPLNAYLLVKRLTSDWSSVEEMMDQSSIDSKAYVTHFKDYRSKHGFPGDEDLAGVASALARLQQTYKIDTNSLARGQIRGVRNSPKLTAEECYLLGRQFFFASEYRRCYEWMREAYRAYMVESQNGLLPQKSTLSGATSSTANDDNSDGVSSMYEHIAFCAYKIGLFEEAVTFGRRLVAQEPTHPRGNSSLQFYEQDFAAQQHARRRGEPASSTTTTTTTTTTMTTPASQPQQDSGNNKNYLTSENDKTGKTGLQDDGEYQRDRINYEILCRGDRELPQRIMRKLWCFLSTRNNHPQWVVQPLRVEEVYPSPYIVVFRNVLFEHEMRRIKQMATEHLQRATVQNPDTGVLETASYRISKSAWFGRGADPVVSTVTDRVGHMTGLDADIAEELQIANYGIGGHYEPHFDFARPEEKDAFKSLDMGNRLATVLFYMSDVEAGGATVFPRLDLTLWPEKGSAAFWYNLKRNGDGDYRTRHAACPVLSGVKWVSNKWIHEEGQWLYRPCSLNPDE